MKRMLKSVFVVALVAGFLPAVVSADDQDVIDYRQHIMKTLEEQSAVIGMILSSAAPTDSTAAHLQVIALTAQTALKSFEPKVPGGESKPQVWSDWADFSKRMNEFVTNAREAAALAKEKGPDDPNLPAKILDALPCKSCHDIYRLEKK